MRCWGAACGQLDGGAAPSGAGGEATIRGTVMVRPSCPVEHAESPCPPAPARSALVQLRQGTNVAVHTRTGPDGSFHLGSGAGAYTLRVVAGAIPRQWSRPVTLAQGDTTTIHVVVDSGIR